MLVKISNFFTKSSEYSLSLFAVEKTVINAGQINLLVPKNMLSCKYKNLDPFFLAVLSLLSSLVSNFHSSVVFYFLLSSAGKWLLSRTNDAVNQHQNQCCCGVVIVRCGCVDLSVLPASEAKSETLGNAPTHGF